MDRAKFSQEVARRLCETFRSKEVNVSPTAYMVFPRKRKRKRSLVL